MGTRADFYIGRGTTAEWIGSVGWDGYPDAMPKELFDSTNDAAFRIQVARLDASREDFTHPDEGWPWPWDNSQLTDFSYAFDEQKVWASCFGYAWQLATEFKDIEDEHGPRVEFPDMSARKNVQFGKK